MWLVISTLLSKSEGVHEVTGSQIHCKSDISETLKDKDVVTTGHWNKWRLSVVIS